MFDNFFYFFETPTMKWLAFWGLFLFLIPLCCCRESPEKLLEEFMKDKWKYNIDSKTTKIEPLPSGQFNDWFYMNRKDYGEGKKFWSYICKYMP